MSASLRFLYRLVISLSKEAVLVCLCLVCKDPREAVLAAQPSTPLRMSLGWGSKSVNPRRESGQTKVHL